MATDGKRVRAVFGTGCMSGTGASVVDCARTVCVDQARGEFRGCRAVPDPEFPDSRSKHAGEGPERAIGEGKQGGQVAVPDVIPAGVWA